MQKGWINGGFFVVDPTFIDYIKDETIMLEREPMQYLTKKQELVAFRHNGYWQCMDTKREFDHLNSMWNEGRPGWIMEDK